MRVQNKIANANQFRYLIEMPFASINHSQRAHHLDQLYCIKQIICFYDDDSGALL